MPHKGFFTQVLAILLRSHPRYARSPRHMVNAVYLAGRAGGRS
jgi:hypothetical protein